MKKTLAIASIALAAALSAAALTGCAEQQAQTIEEPTETVKAVYEVYDTSDGVAVTVNGVELGEKAVTAYVDSKRSLFDLTDEETWSQYLAQNSMTPEELRAQIIDQMTEQEIIRQAAADNGIEVTEEEVDAAYESMKESAGNESVWRIYLKQNGMTEYDAREAQRMSLYQKKLRQLATGTNDLESLIDQITSQMLTSAAQPEALVELQDQLANLPETASEEERADLEAQVAAEEEKAAESLASAQELVDLIDAGIAKLKEAMDDGQVVQPSDEELLAYIQQSDARLEALDSLEGLPASTLDALRAQLLYEEFMGSYLDSADVEVNDAPAGLSYFVVVTAAPAEADEMAEEGQDAEAAQAE